MLPKPSRYLNRASRFDWSYIESYLLDLAETREYFSLGYEITSTKRLVLYLKNKYTSWFQKPGHLSKTGPVGLSYKETIDRLRKVRNLPIHACWKLFVWSFRTTFKKHVYANSEILLSDGRLQLFLFFLKHWKKKRKIRENENMYFSAKNIQFWVLWFYHHFFQEKSVRGIGSQNFDTTSISKDTNDLKCRPGFWTNCGFWNH